MSFPVEQKCWAPARLLLPGGKSLVPGARLAALGVRPSSVPCVTFQGPLRHLMSALGGPNTQHSALNFPLFVENCRFFNATAGFKGELAGEHKSIDLHFIHKQ